MSSPARSSASAASGGQGGGGGNAGFGDDASPYHFPLESAYDRKDEALAGDRPHLFSFCSFWVSVFLMSEFRALKVSFCFAPLLIWFVFWWQALRSELMAALQKEVKSLDDDAWKFAGPRSQIHRISRPGTLFFLVCQLISLHCCLFFCQSIHQKVSDLNYERDGRGRVLIKNHKK